MQSCRVLCLLGSVTYGQGCTFEQSDLCLPIIIRISSCTVSYAQALFLSRYNWLGMCIERLCMAAGALGEMVKELGPHAKPLYSPIVSVVGRELMCQEAVVRRNAAYALGRLFQHVGANLLVQHPALSKVLESYIYMQVQPSSSSCLAGSATHTNVGAALLAPHLSFW